MAFHRLAGLPWNMYTHTGTSYTLLGLIHVLPLPHFSMSNATVDNVFIIGAEVLVLLRTTCPSSPPLFCGLAQVTAHFQRLLLPLLCARPPGSRPAWCVNKYTSDTALMSPLQRLFSRHSHILGPAWTWHHVSLGTYRQSSHQLVIEACASAQPTKAVHAKDQRFRFLAAPG